jgi:hypothetical protein
VLMSYEKNIRVNENRMTLLRPKGAPIGEFACEERCSDRGKMAQ